MNFERVIVSLAAIAALASPALAGSIALTPAQIDVTSIEGGTNNAVQSSTTDGVISLSVFGDSYTTSSFTPSLNGIVENTPGSMSVAGSGGSAYISASGFSSPNISGSGSGNSAGSQAELTYQFEVTATGTDLGVAPVQIGVSSTGSVSASASGAINSANVSAELLIAGDTGTVLDDDSQVCWGYTTQNATNCDLTTGAGFIDGGGMIGASSGGSGGFDETGSYSIDTDTVYTVTMSVNMSIDGTNTASGNYSIDPVITVPEGYTLDLSSGAGDLPSATPEPSAWLLLSTGLLALGIVARKKRFAQRG